MIVKYLDFPLIIGDKYVIKNIPYRVKSCKRIIFIFYRVVFEKDMFMEGEF
jgi:hypothetical protein